MCALRFIPIDLSVDGFVADGQPVGDLLRATFHTKIKLHLASCLGFDLVCIAAKLNEFFELEVRLQYTISSIILTSRDLATNRRFVPLQYLRDRNVLLCGSHKHLNLITYVLA